MPRTLFKSAKVGEHIKEVSRVAGFYANTRREMNLTSLSDAPEKNAPAAALRREDVQSLARTLRTAAMTNRPSAHRPTVVGSGTTVVTVIW